MAPAPPSRPPPFNPTAGSGGGAIPNPPKRAPNRPPPRAAPSPPAGVTGAAPQPPKDSVFGSTPYGPQSTTTKISLRTPQSDNSKLRDSAFGDNNQMDSIYEEARLRGVSTGKFS